MDKKHEKKFGRTRRGPESGNTHRFTKNSTKNISNWKTPGHDKNIASSPFTTE